MKTTGITAAQKEEMLQMNRDGKTTKEIAQHFGIKEAITYYYIAEEKKKIVSGEKDLERMFSDDKNKIEKDEKRGDNFDIYIKSLDEIKQLEIIIQKLQNELEGKNMTCEECDKEFRLKVGQAKEDEITALKNEVLILKNEATELTERDDEIKRLQEIVIRQGGEIAVLTNRCEFF